MKCDKCGKKCDAEPWDKDGFVIFLCKTCSGLQYMSEWRQIVIRRRSDG
jgi:hypothetical protein